MLHMNYLVDDLPYNPSDPEDILDYAERLIGQSFKDVCSVNTKDSCVELNANKGRLGQYLEMNYFFYELNSDNEPDFKDAGVELKVSPVKKLQSGNLVSKERIVLNIINYMKVVDEEWEHSSFLHKNSLLLLVFYLFESDTDKLDYLIKFVTLWSYNDTDLAIIKKDWERIVAKVRDGKAHELSEGDSMYLGACTKGATSATSFRDQPNSETRAKQRAFCLKQKYVNYILSTLTSPIPSSTEDVNVEPLIKNADELSGDTSFEDIIQDRLSEYSDKTFDEVYELVGEGVNRRAKSRYADLASRMLGLKKNRVEEFEKADIKVKTIRLSKAGTPKEAMSFPSFKYKR